MNKDKAKEMETQNKAKDKRIKTYMHNAKVHDKD
jgi:hypothetical protein